MFWPIVLFLLGFALLIKGGDFFVDGAVGIAHRFHMSELLIGATVVSIGTTLPETMVSAQAAFEGNAGISYGNAIGSIICNTALVAAITVTALPGRVKRRSMILPSAFFFVMAAVYCAFAWTAGSFSRLFGICLLTVFAVYIVVSAIHMKKHPEDSDESEEAEGRKRPVWLYIVMLVAGAAAIAIGSRLLVDNGTIIASELGVPDSVIGLTMVALGTSLPELITALKSLSKGHGALSIGNIIGANLFNITLVSGAAITISPFAIPAEKTLGGINSSLIVDIPVMLLVMLILCVPAFIRGKLSRAQGIILLLIYAAFTVYQFVM